MVLSGAALFGTVGTAQALGPDAPPLQLAAARLLLAAILLVAFAVAAGHAGRIAVYARQAPAWWAGLGQAGFNLCFLAAMKEAGVAVGTLVAIGATPILTGLVTRHVSRAWIIATSVAVAGLALLVLGQPGGGGGPTSWGIVLAFGASASYATYILAGNVGASRGLETQPFLAVSFWVAALLTLPLLLTAGMSWVLTPSGALLVLYLAAVPTLLAYSLFNRGLHGVRASTAATLGLIEPVVAACLAVFVLGETLGVVGVAGATLILAGLLAIVRATKVPAVVG